MKKWKIRFCQAAISVGKENLQINPGLDPTALHIESVLPYVQIRNIQKKRQRLVHCPKLSQNQLWMTYPASVCDWWKQISYNWETPLQLGVKEEHFTQMQWLLHAKPPVSKWGQKRGEVQWAPEPASTLSIVGTVDVLTPLLLKQTAQGFTI